MAVVWRACMAAVWPGLHGGSVPGLAWRKCGQRGPAWRQRLLTARQHGLGTPVAGRACCRRRCLAGSMFMAPCVHGNA
eukprot:230079-Chlamydomonas_euryale.AAC.2